MIPESIKHKLVGTIIGAVRVNKPQKYTDKNYECAAWWETRLSETGIFAVKLGQSYFSPWHLHAYADIDAKVIDDYFPALFGGVKC